MLRIFEVCHHGFWLHNQDDILCVPAECLDDELSLKLSICVFIRFVSHKCRNFRLRGFKKLQKKTHLRFLSWFEVDACGGALKALKLLYLVCVFGISNVYFASAWGHRDRSLNLDYARLLLGTTLVFWLIRYSLRTSLTSLYRTFSYHLVVLQ